MPKKKAPCAGPELTPSTATVQQSDPSAPRKPGALEGKIHISQNFDAPLPPEIAAAFNAD